MRKVLVLVAGLAFAAGVLHAQSDDDEDEMDYFPLVPTGSSLKFGLRYVGGPKVSFGQLGYLASTASIGDTTGSQTRSYMDGVVNLDPRKDPNGNPVNDGLTNTWNYDFTSQVTSTNDIAFHNYGVTPAGGGYNAKRTNGSGWELEVGKTIHKFGKLELSLMGGFSFTSLLGKMTSTVPATLVTTTDVYSLYGQPVPVAPYSAPSYGTQYVYDANGNPVLNPDGSPQTRSVDTSTLLGSQPTSRTVTTGTTNLHGRWQIKGSYYTIRVGPLLRFPVTERLKISLSAGAAMAFIGTRYLAEESIDLTDVESQLTTTEEATKDLAIPAYYADADAEYQLTERTGFYLGATYQKSGNYDQTLNGRTAQIDMSSTYGFQSGFSLRF